GLPGRASLPRQHPIGWFECWLKLRVLLRLTGHRKSAWGALHKSSQEEPQPAREQGRISGANAYSLTFSSELNGLAGLGVLQQPAVQPHTEISGRQHASSKSQHRFQAGNAVAVGRDVMVCAEKPAQHSGTRCRPEGKGESDRKRGSLLAPAPDEKSGGA